MNKRTMSIITDLTKDDSFISIDDLAAKYEVSQRTIRNDINAVNEKLREYKLGELKLKSGGIIEKSKDFSEILGKIDGSDYYTYKLSQEERKKVAAALLINSSEYITLSTIADNLFVSRATIINDLDDIKEFIGHGKLEVVSHPNKGLRVEGTELNKRKFLMRLVDNGDMHKPSGLEKQTSIQAGNSLIIRKIVSEQEHVYKRFLTDESFQGIVQYLGILVNRNMQGEYIEPQPKGEEECYLMAVDILKYVSQYCNIVTTEDEVRYFSSFLSRVSCMKKKSFEPKAVKIQMITRQFIERVSEELGMNLSGDYDFFENLSNHLESIFSVENPAYSLNDIVKEVLESNQEVLRAVEKNIWILQQYAGRKIEQVEYGYIAIHICAAIERKKNKEIAFHVIVACHAGIGTSQLLMERLKKHFNFQIVDIISAHDAKNVDPDKVDFVIATVPLKECRVEYVIVSPLLSDEDYLRIGNKIDTLRSSRHLPSRVETKEITASGMIDALSPIIRELAPEKEQLLLKEIKKKVREYFRQPIETDAEIFAPFLHHLLTSDHLELDVECSDWKDAVRKSATILLREGYVEDRYIEAMLDNIEENGPYIVISPGFAIPHAGLEMGSVKVGMSLIRLKTPVPFGAEEMDPVEFVCCLSAIDHKTHLKAFFHLVNLLQKEGFKEALHECRTQQEMVEVIERMEYSLEES